MIAISRDFYFRFAGTIGTKGGVPVSILLRLLRPIIKTALVFSVVSQAFACTCGARRPCSAFTSAPVAFIGQALSESSGKVIFRVDRAFKGVQSATTVAVHTSANTSCSADFALGTKYVVLAQKAGPNIWTNQCQGSTVVGGSELERYANDWLAGKTKPEIVGAVWPRNSGDPADYAAMQSTILTTKKPDTIDMNVRPRSNGEFAVPVPHAGRYQVSPRLRGWISDPPRVDVDVPQNGCEEVFFSMLPDHTVAGTAVEPGGQPAANVLLKLVPSDGFGDELETTTDALGRFSFRGVLMGTYKLGVNPNRLDDPSPKVPYAPAYYPGVPKESAATTVTVGKAARLTLSTFKLPPRLRPRTIRVSVVLQDGRSIEDASVSCTIEGRNYWHKHLTDRNGVKTFDAMTGIPYIVDVDIPSGHPFANAGFERAKWVRVPAGEEPVRVRVVINQRPRGASK